MGNKELLRTIYRFIISELRFTEEDFNIINCKNISEVGKFFANITTRNVQNASFIDIKEVLKRVNKMERSFESEEEFYTIFANFLGYFNAPRNTYIQTLRKYIKLHKAFTEIITIIDQKIEKINEELQQQKGVQERIINRSNFERRFKKDLRQYEDQLINSYQKCNDLTTEKEMLSFSKENLIQQFGVLNNKDIKSLILPYLKKITLDLVREKEMSVDEPFEYYYQMLDITKSNVENYFKIFFKVKLYKFIEDHNKDLYSKWYYMPIDEAIMDYEKKINGMPEINVLCAEKEDNPSKYKRKLKDLISQNKVVEYIKNSLETSYCIKGRETILKKALDLYAQEQYDIFNNIVPIQLEGIFSDYLKDVTTIDRFSDLNLYENSVLRKKIEHLQGVNSGIYTEAVLYFYYYFNNRIRNVIAHGNYDLLCQDKETEEIFALELMLDLNFLIYMIKRQSESEKMYRFINKYKTPFNILKNRRKNNHFGGLLNDLNGTRLHLEYDKIEYPRPMQIVYWLINPYYEEVYKRIGDVEDLLDLRSDLLSTDFWEYVEGEIDKSENEKQMPFEINEEFPSIVKGLFSCIYETDTKKVLARVNAKLTNL